MLDKLRDIKGIVAVTDYSIYYLILICAVLLLILGVAIYMYLQPRKRKKPTEKELALIKLRNIDFDDQKAAAYTFCLNAPYLLNEKNEAGYKRLCDRLEEFKYKKEVPVLKEDLKKEIKDFIGGLK